MIAFYIRLFFFRSFWLNLVLLCIFLFSNASMPLTILWLSIIGIKTILVITGTVTGVAVYDLSRANIFLIHTVWFIKNCIFVSLYLLFDSLPMFNGLIHFLGWFSIRQSILLNYLHGYTILVYGYKLYILILLLDLLSSSVHSKSETLHFLLDLRLYLEWSI